MSMAWTNAEIESSNMSNTTSPHHQSMPSAPPLEERQSAGRDVENCQNAQQPEKLVCIADFFCDSKGKNWVNTEEKAKGVWQYRRHGRDKVTPPKGKEMLNEVMSLKSKLVEFVEAAHMDCCRAAAVEQNLKVGDGIQHLHSKHDFRDWLTLLENTEDNARIVHEVFFRPTRKREWLYNTIQKWADREGMIIKVPVRTDNKRKSHKDLGGFTVVAREKKNNMCKLFMSHLMRRQQWSVAVTPTFPKKASEAGKPPPPPPKFDYTLLTLPVSDIRNADGLTLNFYVVTPRDQGQSQKMPPPARAIASRAKGKNASNIRINVSACYDTSIVTCARSLTSRFAISLTMTLVSLMASMM